MNFSYLHVRSWKMLSKYNLNLRLYKILNVVLFFTKMSMFASMSFQMVKNNILNIFANGSIHLKLTFSVLATC